MFTLREWRYFFAFLFIFISVIFFLSGSIFCVENKEPFMSMAILDENQRAEEYYMGDYSDIRLNETVSWSIQLDNEMGYSQYVSIVIKISVENTSQLNFTICKPSSAQNIYEFRKVLLDKEILIIPFNWSIENIKKYDDLLYLSEIVINSNKIKVDMDFNASNDIVFIFELWTFNSNSSEFIFSWMESGKNRCIRNIMPFNVTFDI